MQVLRRETLAANDYVGIPWVRGGGDISGADCWGLTVLVIREVYGIDIEQYGGSKASGEELTGIIESELSKDYWQPPSLIKPGDMCMMYSRKSGFPSHMGVFIGDGMVIHSPEPSKPDGVSISQIHPIRVLNRAYLKLEFYRYDHSLI